jgi:hypothetical protein
VTRRIVIQRQPGAFNRISVTARFSDTLVQYEKEGGAVKLYRSLHLVGDLEFANREQSEVIHDANYQQNRERSNLPITQTWHQAKVVRLLQLSNTAICFLPAVVFIMFVTAFFWLFRILLAALGHTGS